MYQAAQSPRRAGSPVTSYPRNRREGMREGREVGREEKNEKKRLNIQTKKHTYTHYERKKVYYWRSE